MAMLINSKLHISEGRGQPVSLKVKIDGCSDHGSNNDLLAEQWTDILKTNVERRTASKHCEVEATFQVINFKDYFFILGERKRLPHDVLAYQQDLYAVRATGASRSLAAIQTDLFGSKFFESSEEHYDAIVLPTKHARKVCNRLMVRTTKPVPTSDEHYHAGSVFYICRQDDSSLYFATPASHNNIAVPCVDSHDDYYQSEMRRVEKHATPVVQQPLQNMNANFASTNHIAQIQPKQGSLSRVDHPHEVMYTTSTSELDPYEEKGSTEPPIDYGMPGPQSDSVFGPPHVNASAPRSDSVFGNHIGGTGEEIVLMSKENHDVKKVSSESSNYCTAKKEIDEGHHNPTCSHTLSHPSDCTQSEDTDGFYDTTKANNSSEESVEVASSPHTNDPVIPVAASIQATSKTRLESTTIAEEEVFIQAVPPTPTDCKRAMYSSHQPTRTQEKRKGIEDSVPEGVNVEPVEENSNKSNSANRKASEAETGVELPLRTQQQQQCVDEKEQALVIPTINPSPNPSMSPEIVKRRLFQDVAPSPQQSRHTPTPVVPGITNKRTTDSGCYVSSGRPVQVSQQPSLPRNGLPSRNPPRPYNLAPQPSAYTPGFVSVPNGLAQPQYHFNKEQTNATVTNPPKSSPVASFSTRSLMPYYPLCKGKIIHVSKEAKIIFKEGSVLPSEQLDRDDNKIGSGGNGSVFTFRYSGKRFAVKETEFRPRELQLWAQFYHPCITPLYSVAIKEYYVSHPHKSVVWQFMPELDSDLSTVVDYGHLAQIKENKPEHVWLAAYSNFKHIVRKTLSGVEYLHQRGIVHRDIKERNVFYKMKCEHGIPYECTCPDNNKCFVVIGDFDAITMATPASVTQTATNSHVLGTKHYRPPEMLSKDGVTTSVDIFSVGCMVIKLCDGRKQHKNEFEMMCKVLQGQDPQQQQYLQELLNMRFKFENILSSTHEDITAVGKFVKGCINNVPEERPSATALLQHPFLN